MVLARTFCSFDGKNVQQGFRQDRGSKDTDIFTPPMVTATLYPAPAAPVKPRPRGQRGLWPQPRRDLLQQQQRSLYFLNFHRRIFTPAGHEALSTKTGPEGKPLGPVVGCEY